jgi:hypothetical protein
VDGVRVCANTAYDDEVLNLGAFTFFEQTSSAFYIHMIEQSITPTHFGTG